MQNPQNKNNSIFLIEILAVGLFMIFYIFIFYFLNILNIRYKIPLLDFIPTIEKNTTSNVTIPIPTPKDNFPYDVNFAKKYLIADLVDYLQLKYFLSDSNITQQEGGFNMSWKDKNNTYSTNFAYDLKSNRPNKTLIIINSFTNLNENPQKIFSNFFKSKLQLSCQQIGITYCFGTKTLSNKDILLAKLFFLSKNINIRFCHIYYNVDNIKPDC